ncbi:MAG: hypothetical protein NW207_02665 [Cytophagales bacterium]|nr:hypothetical protein [Cytophagales bacterium]
MTLFIHRISILAIIIVFFTSCLKETIKPEKIEDIQTRVGLPFIYSSLRIDDVVSKLEDDEFSIRPNEQGYYSFYFDPDTAFFPTFEELIVLPSQNIPVSSLPAIPVPPGQNEIPALTTLPSLSFKIGESGTGSPNKQDDFLLNSDTKTIEFKGGTMSMEMAYGGDEFANLDILIDNITDAQNNPIKFSFKINKDSDINANKKIVTLAGYTLKLSGSNSFNIRTTKVTFTDPQSTNGASPKQTSSLANLSFISFRMDNPKWKKIVTKLGNFELPIVENGKLDLQTISLEPFKNNESDNPQVEFGFENPIVKVNFLNSTGIRSDLKMSPISAISKMDNVVSTISSQVFSLARSNNGELTSFVTTISPALLKTLFLKGPKQLEYGLLWSVDANSKTSDSDFILDKSRFATKVNIEIPLWGNVKLFDLRSKVDYAFNQSNTTVEDTKRYLQDATFKMNFRNQMPIDFIVQFQFLDANNKVVDSLFSSNKEKSESGFIVAAPVDANGISTGESKPAKPIEVFISKERLEKLDRNAKFVLIKAAMNTKDYDKGIPRLNVKIFPEDSLIVQLSLNAGINFSFENDNKK